MKTFIFVVLIVNANPQYYYNGTTSLLNPVESLVWAGDQYMTFKSGQLFITESLQDIQGKYEIYRSHVQPMSDNINYFYTKIQTPQQHLKQVTFFNRINQPLCWLDSNDIDNDKIQKVLIKGQNIYMLQNRTKIRIHTLQDPSNQEKEDNNEIPDCLHQRYNWTNKDNQKYEHKEMISLYYRDELAITYYDHIQLLSKNSQNQFIVLQTIELTQNPTYRQGLYRKQQNLNYRPYKIKYFVSNNQQPNQNKQLLVMVFTEQLWVYHRLKQYQKFSYVDNIRLNETILSLEIISTQETYVLVKDDCSVYKVSLIDEKILPKKIASYSTLCTQSLITPKLGVKKNNDVLIIAIQKVQYKQLSYQQLIIHVTPIEGDKKNSIKQELIYNIPLKYKQTYFSLLDYEFIQESDFLYLLLQQTQTNSQLFIGFQIGKLKNEQKTELKWQWISDRFQNGVMDSSIDQTGIIVLEYNPLQKIQELTWYQTTILVDQFKSQQPSQISRINTIAFYQNSQQTNLIAYNFILQQQEYKLNISKNFYSSPNGNINIQIKQNQLNKIEVFNRQIFIGMIQIDHQINIENTILQFMNDSVIVELVKVQKQNQVKIILNGYVFDYQIQNGKFQYTVLQPLQITQITLDQIKINSYNIVYLNTQQGKIIILSVGQNSFQIQQKILLPTQIQNSKSLLLGLSEEGNIYTVQSGKFHLHEWIYCEYYEYFQNGECLHKPIDPVPNPFSLTSLIAALIGGIAIIFVVTWQIIKSRSTQRRVNLQRNLIQQEI